MKMTSDGVQYLEHTERVTKTIDGTTKDTRAFQTKMFADPENPRCPVETFKNYLRHRPADMVQDDSPFYFGCARQIKDNVWYSRQPLGKNTLNNFVKEMCDEAGIQSRHTNHSARKTTVTALVHEDKSDTTIMQLSGHKNVQSINTYSSASMEQQKQMSNILSKVGTGNVTNSDINKVENVELFHDIINNDITAKEMPDDDGAYLLSASQEAKLIIVNEGLSDITNYESKNAGTHCARRNEVPEIVNQ